MHRYRVVALVLVSLLLMGPLTAWSQDIAAPAVEPPATGQTDPADASAQSGLDATGTADDKPASRVDELIAKFKQGGLTVWVQLALSILGMSVVIERMVNLRQSRIVPLALADEADRLWKQGKYDELEKKAAKDGSVLGLTIASIVKHRHADPAIVSSVAGDVASRELRRHIQKLYPIAIVATLEPLLGLLGTIIGMIGAFDTVARLGSMGDPSALADDIAKALVTTAVGLIIAIPALFLYQYLKSRVAYHSAALDEEVSDMISDWLVLAKLSPIAAGVSAPSTKVVSAAPQAGGTGKGADHAK